MKKICVIAEIGSVHDGSFGNCVNLIKEAKIVGANIVKLQHHLPDEETIKTAPSPKYFNLENRYNYFKRTAFDKSQWKKLIRLSKKLKIDFMSSVFSIASYKFLINLGVKNIKIPSGEVTNLPLLKEIAKNKKLKIYLSTGMSNWNEIYDAVKILKNNNLCIFQCTSMYPCPPEHVGLNIIKDIKKKFNKKFKIGFSDHTIGNVAAILALSNGATVFEKHFTFSNKMYGSDAKFATEPTQFKNYCNSLMEANKILSTNVDKNKIKIFSNMRKVFQKSIYFSDNFTKGTKITFNSLAFKKPDKGISASNYEKFIGLKLKKDVKKNELLNINHF